MSAIKLSEMLSGVEVVKSTAAANLELSGICSDSRLARRGDLFVAIHGSHDNGYRYIEQARSRGVVAIASDQPPPPSKLAWIQVAETRQAVAQMAANFYRQPSHHLELVGVTGTNGKTTVAGVVRDLLQAAGRKTGLLSTVEYAYGERVIAASRTTPDAITLQRLLAAMRDDHCQAAVMEVSSHALVQHRTGATRFAAAAFTNLTRDHLDYHHDLENYFATKLRLFEQLAALNPGHPAIINADDPYGQRLIKQLAQLPLKVVTYGLTAAADISAADLKLSGAGTRFTLNTPCGTAPIKSALLGRYNVANLLCASALALACELPFELIIATLPQIKSRWGRLERVATPHPATIFVDYAHTDDALRNVLATLREITPGRLVLVFGCGGDRDRTKRPLMGSAALELADDIIITSDNPRTEDPAAIIADILAGCDLQAHPGKTLQTEPERRSAIARGLQLVTQGDTLLIAGKGHETYQEVQYHKTPFDDREEVRRLATRGA